MPTQPRLLVFAGSTRTASLNKKLAAAAAAAAGAAGAAVTPLDLRDLSLPLYDGDLEEAHGLPDGAIELKDLMKAHEGFLIASPEHNSSVSAALKNAIDWASRPAGDSVPLAAFRGKVAGLLSASPGALGGLRGLFQLRWILTNIHVLVVPEQATVARAGEAFDEQGRLKDEKHRKAVEAVAQSVAALAAARRG